MNFSTVTIAGRLTETPELRKIGSGEDAISVCDLRIAFNRRQKNGEKAVFVDASAFRRNAEVACEYCQKGDLILVEGELDLDTWEKDGVKRSKLKVLVNRVQLAPKGTASSGSEKPSKKEEEAPEEQEIPF